jgi:hypothetical protein
MESITTPFQRGGKPFEATFTNESCFIRDLTADPRFALQYKIEITGIEVKLRASGQSPYIKVSFKTGLETATGEMVNVFDDFWLFDESHPDLQFFTEQFGLAFMMSSVNGFVKHKLPQNARYQALTSNFGQVFSDAGQYLPENND